MKPATEELIIKMKQGDRRALARLMTYVDNRHEDILPLMSEIHKLTGKADRIGVTGPPGAGKSTLTDKLIAQFRAQGKKVGVVCIDPSSPFTGGAVLGDRIRMMDHAADDGVFIRSLGSRGSHGGLSRATRDVVSLLDAFGFDVILIETVGVGQTELDIMSVAHTVLVVLVPESGDTIQTMKAGLMEIADIFVVNKADREGADRIFAELRGLAEMYSGKSVNQGYEAHHNVTQNVDDQLLQADALQTTKIGVFKTEAFRGKGITEVLQAIQTHLQKIRTDISQKIKLDSLLKEECFDIVLSEIHYLIEDSLKNKENLKKIMEELQKDKNPYEAASKILLNLFKPKLSIGDAP